MLREELLTMTDGKTLWVLPVGILRYHWLVPHGRMLVDDRHIGNVAQLDPTGKMAEE